MTAGDHVVVTVRIPKSRPTETTDRILVDTYWLYYGGSTSHLAIIEVTACTSVQGVKNASIGRLSLWKSLQHSWNVVFWVRLWNNWSSDHRVRCTRNTVQTRSILKTHSLTLMKFGSCWGELNVVYLLPNEWMQRIFQEIVTSSAIGSSKLDLRAQSIFALCIQRINLSKPAYCSGRLNSFHIIRTSMQNITRNISKTQSARYISGRCALHFVRDCRSILLVINQLQCLWRLIQWSKSQAYEVRHMHKMRFTLWTMRFTLCSGRCALHFVRDCQSILLVLIQLQCLWRLI